MRIILEDIENLKYLWVDFIIVTPKNNYSQKHIQLHDRNTFLDIADIVGNSSLGKMHLNFKIQL